MNRIKLWFVTIAIVVAIGGAFASRPKDFCETQTQYYKFMGSYFPAGEYGRDYVCMSSAGTCTWYLADPFDPNSYTPCRNGTIEWVF